MADVPAWVLIVNTLAVGGFGLANAFIVPKAQRVAKAAEKQDRAHAIMREKAEQIFDKINIARQANNDALIRVASILQDNSIDTGAYDPTVFRVLDPILGLVATYYPAGMDVIQRGRQAMSLVTDPLNVKLKDVQAQASKEAILLRMQMVTAVAGGNIKIFDDLNAFLMAAVVPYLPN